MTRHKLGHFHGGLHLDEHKAESTGRPIRTLPPGTQLVLPLHQHIGHDAEPMVRPGDKVGKGQMIAQPFGDISAAIHAPTSGKVVAIEKRPFPHSSGLAVESIVSEADGEDRWAEGLPAPVADYRELSAPELTDRIRDAGIVGLGGAAFPTAAKLRIDKNSIQTLIINGAECEPWITCDDMLMREQADGIVSGIAILQHLLRPQQTLIGIEDNKPDAIAAMRKALATARLEQADVVVIPTLYPSGGEKQLIKILVDKEVPSGGLPLHVGIICQNVGTAFAIHEAIVEGKPLIERIVTVTGDGVREPQNLRLRIGTAISAAVAAAGGYADNVAELLIGGPMMGVALGDDTPPLIKSSNCVLAATPAGLRRHHDAHPCIRCGECADVCPAQLLPQQLYWYSRARDFDKAEDFHLFDCIECGCCDYVCPSHIPLVQYYRHAKGEIRLQRKEKEKADRARIRHQLREERLAREAAERAARLAAKKAALEKKKAAKEGTSTENDPKKDAIAAALERAKARKAALQREKAGKTVQENNESP
jgi:electron transport complex protein RnfC